MKLNVNPGDKVDLVTNYGRQRATVTRAPSGKRGPTAMVGLKVRSIQGSPFKGEVDALQAQVTPRLNRKYM